MDIKVFWKRYNLYIAGGLFLITAAALAFLIFFGDDGAEAVEPFPVQEVTEESEEAPVETLDASIFVEVKGAVEYPGVFEMPKDARVKNVLEMAQPDAAADLLTVNQSMKLADEMVIYVPKKGEAGEFDPAAGFGSQADAGDDTVNINTAGVPELTSLNGIGEKKAQLIIDYREESGLFMTPEDLMNVQGIGEKTFESLKPYITID
ncbi:helix-hairpin-helix domain-containing protein [Salinicoccus carnicancri]|uniref:helix-hairpin-helix domain-containing protein n=1 Tax=Salinicoccus carnicancri TaxID=558170 RepID=UPI000304A9AB|nr:helix-hairpin-helix domain-containing protein [Salinicoccus carnicancri]